MVTAKKTEQQDVLTAKIKHPSHHRIHEDSYKWRDSRSLHDAFT